MASPNSATMSLLCFVLATWAICSSASMSRCVDKERQALLEFKRGLEDTKNLLSSWTSKEDCCQWRGISCDNQTGHVVALDLRSPLPYDGNFGGEIYPSLLGLRHLNYLDLSSNYFIGLRVPRFIGSFAQLNYLNLSGAGFSGLIPHQLGNLSTLRTLDLSLNDAIIDNLDWLSGLSSLRYLSMSGLSLSNVGENWPQSINRLSTNLKELYLYATDLPNVGARSLTANNSLNLLEVIELSSNFLSSPSIVSWVTNISTSLVYIRLHSCHIEGPIPDVFANMVSLVFLDLSNNQLEGALPESFRSLCNLESLVLWSNGISDELHGSLEKLSCTKDTLKFLYLSYNKFWGTFPDISRFSSLTDMFINENYLTGTLYGNVGRLSKLEHLDLDHNQLSGPLPDFTGFSSLRSLRLSNNKFNGSIPMSIAKLSLLEYMDLSSNLLSGVMTEAHFLNLSHLQSLEISQNNLSLNVSSNWLPPFQLGILSMGCCKIGYAFPIWLQTQRNLQELDLSNTGISDPIPNWFWDQASSLLSLNLSFNHIHGKFPSFSSIFVPQETLDLSSNKMSGLLPLIPPTMSTLILSKNMFSGSISSLCSLQNNTMLTELDLSDNKFSGEIPNCWAQFELLMVLNLGSNNFTGRIPTSLGYLPNIMVLLLRKNNLTGEVPFFRNSERLAFLDLGENRISGNLPEFLGESSKYLMVLRLRSNEFNGNIPTSWCNLQFLHVLDLSLNNITGILPQCIADMTAMSSDSHFSIWMGPVNVMWKGLEREFGANIRNMKSIDVSSNCFGGTIPTNITSLLKLVMLNLSRNNFMGNIPVEFGRLRRLESLDLSRNWISGAIPESFSSLSFLGKMDLSYNNLSGRIPLSTQLQGFDASDFAGNMELCGVPLKKYCPGDEIEQHPGGETDKYKDDQEDKFVTFGFYVSMGVGFFVGFWTIFGLHLLMRDKRIWFLG